MKKAHIDAALKHLKKDARMKVLIKAHPARPQHGHGRDPFESLARAIVFQQLSGKAAGTIWDRVAAYYPGQHPTAALVAKTPAAKFRKAGVSAQKAGYLKDLADKFLDGTINPKLFSKMTDEEVREHVTGVKGIGRWTADTFMMFTLNRPDIMPTGDLGIQKGMQMLCNLKKLPSPEQMEKLSKDWSPHRTVACWYLWRSLDNR